jgi:capsular polysaccharide biosynthesis protein
MPEPPEPEVLFEESVVTRKLPVNLHESDRHLFRHELEKIIPATKLLRFTDVRVSPAGVLFRGARVVPESFVYPQFLERWKSPRGRLRAMAGYLLRRPEKLNQPVLWVTDNWSHMYFEWITVALPRVFAIRDRLADATILLPKRYARLEYVVSSLKVFGTRPPVFVDEPVLCNELAMSTHTADPGNYNERIVRELRRLYVNVHKDVNLHGSTDKVYISRAKAGRRKVANEGEIVDLLHSYGFRTVYFEDHTFAEQVRIARAARYLVSNHGAGLTNMLFMIPGSSVLELRRNGDAHNNCFFSLASALELRYYYQLCESRRPDTNENKSDIVVDCQKLRANVERMLRRDAKD